MAAALATTVQRPGGGRAPRYSFASGGNQGLLDLDGWVGVGVVEVGQGGISLLAAFTECRCK